MNIYFAILLAPILLGIALVIVARRHPETRRWAIVTGISIVLIPLTVVLHNVLSAVIQGDEGVTFIVALVVAPAGFAAGALGVGLTLLRSGRARTTGIAITVAALGMWLFVAYGIFSLIVTTIEGTNPPYQIAMEPIVLPTALLALAGGSLAALFSVFAPSRRAPA